MTKNELRLECARLVNCENLTDTADVLNIFSEFMFKAIKNHHLEGVGSQEDANAKIILQMMFTKILHLKQLISGLSYVAEDSSCLNLIIDPTIIGSATRNIYETVSMFNLIYRNTQTNEEKLVLHAMWVHAGLMFRQKFKSVLSSTESTKKFADDKLLMTEIVTLIEETDLYKGLSDHDKNKIQTRLKEKEYLMRFENNKVKFLHWHDLVEVMGLEIKRFSQIYTYLSFYSHPSYVAVFQFSDIFNPSNEEFSELSNFNLKYALSLTSVFIADFINLFPSTLRTFETLKRSEQIAIDFLNTIARDEKYSINDKWKELE
jgi:hypothetical protein